MRWSALITYVPYPTNLTLFYEEGEDEFLMFSPLSAEQTRPQIRRKDCLLNTAAYFHLFLRILVIPIHK